jgi:hypothetical protein
MPQPEWERYKIVDTYAELTTVRHIVHLPVARRIVEDGRIKSGLVFDKSRLNKSRISVTWLSANNWALGTTSAAPNLPEPTPWLASSPLSARQHSGHSMLSPISSSYIRIRPPEPA